MILCLGSLADETFWAGVLALRSHGAQVDIVDLGHFALAGEIRFSASKPLEATLELNGVRRALSSYSGIWVRIIDLACAAPSPSLGSRALATQTSLGTLVRLVSQFMPVVNPPATDNSNFSKCLHSAIHGASPAWRTPRMCLTNDPDEARRFFAEQDAGVIFKGASAAKTWVSVYDADTHGSRLDLLQHGPVLFQERIVGPDVRVHVVDRSCFAERIEAEDVDYRKARGNRYVQQELTVPIERACIELAALLEIPLAGIDFKIQLETGDWYFLEANSMPCFQGYDRRLGGAIGNAIAQYLCGEQGLARA